jgi:peptide/nickel transport system substrate-binding protein
MPKEVVAAGATNWKNVNGTGPFQLRTTCRAIRWCYSKNPVYWDKEKIDGVEYKLPFVDKITYRTIKDEATFITALRTAKLDLLESVRWSAVDELKKSAPQAQVDASWLANGGSSWRCAWTPSRSTTSACAAR